MRAKIMVIVTLTCIVATMSARASAQSPTAKALFMEAMEQMANGNYNDACPRFADSHREDPRPSTLLTVAVCYDRWGKIATAAAVYEEFLRDYKKLPPAMRIRYAERASKAEPRLAELLPQIPRLKLSLPPNAPKGVEIQRNGVALSVASLGVSLPMDPGEYNITTQVGNGPVVEKKITLERGESKAVELDVKLPEPSAPPPDAARPAVAAKGGRATGAGASARPDAARQPRRVLAPYADGVPASASGISGRQLGAIFAGGVGLAGLAIGTVSGVIVLQKKALIEAHCDGSICDAEGMEAAETASLPSAMSTIGFGVGSVALATGVILWLTEPSPTSTGSSRRGVHASFDASPGSAMIWLKGGW